MNQWCPRSLVSHPPAVHPAALALAGALFSEVLR